MTTRETGCPTCPHSLAGFHVAHPPSTSPAQPKTTDQNLECVWCGAYCVRNGNVLTEVQP